MGSRGVQGGYLEISKTGSNTQMAVCRGWGVHMYVCYARTYVHMFLKQKLDLDPWAMEPSSSDFFLEIPGRPGYSLLPSLNPP